MEYKIIYSKIKNVYIHIKNGEVIVKAPRRVSKKEIDEIVNSKEDWIKKTLAKTKIKIEKEKLYTDEEFKTIVEETANELIRETGLIPNKVRISYSKDVIKYVILHELCHIKYMNHSKAFWDLVANYMPNYKEIKKEFK